MTRPLLTAAPKLLAFDWFNTLGRFRDFATREEWAAYAQQIEENRTHWEPFRLSRRWREMPVFDDVVLGVEKLRKLCRVVVFSNAPVPLAEAMIAHNRVQLDGVMPLEDFRVSKPHPQAYRSLANWAHGQYDLHPAEICVVTANETFGDLEGARAAGMQSVLIRGEECPTLFDLAEAIGA